MCDGEDGTACLKLLALLERIASHFASVCAELAPKRMLKPLSGIGDIAVIIPPGPEQL
jgi:hypothetical protein